MHGLCDQPGCRSVAYRRPTLTVPARPPKGTYTQTPQAQGKGEGCFDQGIDGSHRYVVEYEIALEFCAQHAENFNIWHWVDEACWSAIENQLEQRSLAPPSKDDAEVTWVESCGADGLSDEGRRLLSIIKGEELAKPVPQVPTSITVPTSG
jgi:hypothetical protein